MLRFLLLLFLLGLGARVDSHEESGPWSCDSESEIRVEAGFKPGVITLDGHADDWKDIDGSYFPLLPALDPDAENELKGGKMSVKVSNSILFVFLSPIFFFLLFFFFRVCMMAAISSFYCKSKVIMRTLKGNMPSHA